MSTHGRSVDASHTLPENPTYIEFTRSDGNPSTWPSNITRIVDHEGFVNYHEYVPLDASQNIRYRVQVGAIVAKKLNMPEGPTYVLKSFPEGYRMYDHNKGPVNGRVRHDIYIFGPPGKKFRSIFEFAPHATWLIGNGADCECKYCTKKSQREVTASLPIASRGTPLSQVSASPAAPRVRRDKGKGKEVLDRQKPRRDTRVYASVQLVSKPLKPSAGVLKQPMLVERNNDLRAIYSKTSMHLRRWYREGEIVWCALEPPITMANNPEITIRFWPGVVEEVKLKTEPIPRQNGEAVAGPSSTASIPAGGLDMEVDIDNPEQANGPMLQPTDERLPWTIRQSIRYKIHLLAVSHSSIFSDDRVLPYQAYMPPDDLMKFMELAPLELLVFNTEALARFNPCPGLIPPSILDAVPAYATALQIASNVSACWCLTDEYELKYSVATTPPSSPKHKGPPLPTRTPGSQMLPPPAPRTLQEALETASQANANDTIKVTSHSYYRNIQSVNPNMPKELVDKTSQQLLGVPPPPGGLVQIRFQGFWWGGERIWTDDFVRLKIPRRTLAPNGAENILPPAGPSESSVSNWKKQGKLDEDIGNYGAGARGIFLRIDGIFAVDVPNENGATKKEARVCGMLYELADEDWVEASDVKDQSEVANGRDSGGSRPPEVLRPVSEPSSQAGPSSAPLNVASTSKTNGTIEPVIDSLGHPREPDYLLPEAPRGYRFRPILTPGYEFVSAMGLISGRYYPRILSHPKLQPIVDEVMVLAPDEIKGVDRLWSLEGLSGGYWNSVDPHLYKRSRIVMLQDADRESLQQLRGFAEGRREQEARKLDGGDSMEVDDT